MNTISARRDEVALPTARWRGAAAAVTGARHLRAGRNGQDAAARWISVDGHTGAIVVCDGCGSGASSEVGARLAARIAIGAIATCLAPGALRPGATLDIDELWMRVRAEVLATLSAVVDAMPGERERTVHDYFLFTLIAAVVVDDVAHVLAIGDGAYAIDGVVRELGPFADNMPPYLAYELLGANIEVHTDTARVSDSVLVATDGVAEVGLATYAVDARALVRHPDALRRRLALQAKGAEEIDWAARRTVRTPAALQDDGAVALLVRVATQGGSA